MAANNYFGYTHGGTQYGATGATYQTGQAPGYAVAPAAPTAATPYTAQRAGTGYETAYQTATTHSTPGAYAVVAPGATPAPTTYDYGYGRPVQTTYDTTKSYYQQQPQQPPAPGVATYSTTNTQYQQAATTSAATPKAINYTSAYTTQGVQASSYATSYSAPAVVQTTKPAASTAGQANTTYSGYDAAVYNAATTYLAQQAQTTTGVNKTPTGGKTANTWKEYKNRPMTGATGGMKQMKPKQPPKPQQLHYCDVCKISCAGPQTYREHLEGQKHKKKESAQKAGTTHYAQGGNALRCELCDVSCTGQDAYAAHIRGTKHQKVLKLHTKLGKPIPSTDPVVVGKTGKNSTGITSSPKTTTIGSALKTVTPATTGAPVTPKKAITPAPKVNFVEGSHGTIGPAATATTPEVKQEPKDDDPDMIVDKDVKPVGQNYIEEIKNEEGKVISFNCKLCECRFNDPNAKEMHMKGRRHRLQYKKKVDPELIVDVKPSLRQRKIQEEKLRRQQMRNEFWRRRDEDEERMYWEERCRYEEEYEYVEWYRRYGCDPRGPPPPRPFGPPGVPPLLFFQPPMRRPDTSDDRHVIARHVEIYPKEEELQAVQKIVSHTEKALKLVSDFLTETAVSASAPKPAANTPKTATTPDAATGPKKDESKKEDGRDGQLFSFHREKDDQTQRVLKGVMRVGMLAKGLLLHGETGVQLVVLCAEKPTRTLLNKVADSLPKQLQIVSTEDQYKVQRNIDDAAILVIGVKEPNLTVTITLTSPIIREQILTTGKPNDKDPVDVLDKQKCLDALAALRHAKWFQARATGLQSCVMIIRILRDLCNRNPTWAPLNSWPMELLVEKSISSANHALSPGDALRRVMEALAGGILLNDNPGVLDPCEKDPMDAASEMKPQQREDITSSAQLALRLISFRQIHKVLGMDPMPPPKFTRDRFNRKRRRDNSSVEEGNESEGGDGKKDKKED